MQRILQLTINSDTFDKIIFWLENLPKNKVKLKEIKDSFVKPKDEYFYSRVDRYIFALTELDGKNRQKILGITTLHYQNKKLAEKWKKEIAGKIHEDKCNHPKAREAWKIMNMIYEEMISE